MDKLVADLLDIERDAAESMKCLGEERAAQALHISNEIARRNLEIKRKADKDLQIRKQEIEKDTQAQLDEIEVQHQEKIGQLKKLFEEKNVTWREEWVKRILQPEP